MSSCWDSVTEVWPEKMAHILDVARIKKGDSLMDIGTGTGVMLPFMEERIGAEGRITAVDIADKMLEKAKEKYSRFKNITYANLDAETDTIDGKYDCIMIFCVFPHFERPLDTVEWLVKVNLAHGGRLVLAFPESKEKINGIGHHNDGTVHSHPLISAETLAAQLRALGMNVDFIQDDDSYYILRITNK